LTTIGTGPNHLRVACFLDLAHGAHSVLFKVAVVSTVEQPLLSYKSYWFIDSLLFDQLGNLWLMSHDVRELPPSERLVRRILKSLVAPSFVRPEALCLRGLVAQLVVTAEHVLVHIEIKTSLFNCNRRLELLCFPVGSIQLVLPVLLLDNFRICARYHFLDALVSSLQQLALRSGDLRHFAQLISGSQPIV